MSGETEPVLSLEDVTVHYDEQTLTEQTLPDSVLELMGRSPRDPVQAVDDVSIDVEENEVLALVGESGSGKTTLGKTAVGIQRPTEGTVRYRGHDIWDVKDEPIAADIEYGEIRQNLQIIHQDPGNSLNPYRRIGKSLAEPLKRWYPDLDRADRRERMIGLLRRVGVTPAEDYLKRYPHQLSGGEKQRVTLVRTLLMQPDVILADEAVSALDVSLRVEIIDLMYELQEEFNTAFIFVSHNLSDARYFADKADGRIAVMYLGEIIEIGTTEEIIQEPRHPYTRLLRWASTEINEQVVTEGLREPVPVRELDIPDSRNPPAGCRFHNRCPTAREVCAEDSPSKYEIDGEDHTATCFQFANGHSYHDQTFLDQEAADQFERLAQVDRSEED